MAYDKVIDSAQLDGAMKKTADAIRAKTGGSAFLTWNATTGFESAVAAINTGSSGLQYVTGEVTCRITESTASGTEIMSVTGLTFTPKFVSVYANSKWSSANWGSKFNIAMVIGGLMRDNISYDASYPRIDNEADVELTIDGNSFVVKTTGSKETRFNSYYSYIAIG